MLETLDFFDLEFLTVLNLLIALDNQDCPKLE